MSCDIIVLFTDNGYNLPKVTNCTNQLQEYVYGKKDIGNIPSRSLPELVRWFVEDVYLCIYIDHDGVMYSVHVITLHIRSIASYFMNKSHSYHFIQLSYNYIIYIYRL